VASTADVSLKHAKASIRGLVWKRKGEKVFWRIFAYLLLINAAFIFVQPVIYMVSTSFKTMEDLLDPTVYWIPLHFQFENLQLAFKGLYFIHASQNSAVIAIGAALGQIFSCSLVGYGFARCKFPGREILFSLVMFTFLVPPQTIVVSLFILYKKLGWIDTYNPFILPAFFGHGLRGALFVMIFRQFFRGLPFELEDAARVDGCNSISIYSRIMLPSAKPAILIVFLFSLVWHWNDFYEPMMYLFDMEKFTLPLRLSILWTTLDEITGGQAQSLYNEPLVMAASLMTIIPPLVLYIFAQKHFVEGVERTGLVG
jgi:multiple sugar transport system permease protein